MKPHEKKVVERQKELELELEELNRFIAVDLNTVDVFEQDRLKRQSKATKALIDILQERIEHFPL
jgi:hypothetical protein